MKRLWFLLGGLAVGGSILFLFGASLFGKSPAGASPNLHGTPDPDATPHVDEITSFDVIPTYFQDVLPIVEANCVSCHTKGQIGYARYPLETHQDVIDHAEDIGFFVGVRYMPPWPPAGDSPLFQHDRSLTESEVATIVVWAEAGAPPGQPVETVDAPLQYNPGELPSIREDLVLMPDGPFTPDDHEIDAYRCFLLDPGFTEDTFVTGYYLEPGAPSIVHHIIAYQANGRVREEALRKDAEDGQPGWDCYGGTTLQGGAGGFSTSLGDWGPGTTPRPHAPGTGHLMPADSLIIMQVHYNLDAGSAPDQTKLILQLAQEDETLQPLHTLPLLTPVEIPCPDGTDGDACSRDYALAHADSGIAAWAAFRCQKSEEDYIIQPNGNILSFCDYTAFESGYIVRVAGHMHELGTSLRIDLNPDGPHTTLLDIPEWDFDWQSDYLLTEPIYVERGDTVRLTCIWDNTEVDRYIVWGERTQDEMCLGRIIYVPTKGLDSAKFLHNFARTAEQ